MNKLESVRKEIAFLRKAKLNNEIMEYQKIKKCPCCYTKLTIDNTVNMLNCNHALCKKCHIKWFDDECHNTCPMCRTRFDQAFQLSIKELKKYIKEFGGNCDKCIERKELENLYRSLSFSEKLF